LPHFLNASMRTTTAQAMMITLKPMFTQPVAEVAAWRVIGQKVSVIFRTPAVSVVVATKAIGMKVTHAYRNYPEFLIALVPTARATTASSWLAVPNMGQIVVMSPVQRRYPQATTISPVDR